jgi:hypothetical protein
MENPNSYLFLKYCSPNGAGAAFIDSSKKVSIGFVKVTFGPPRQNFFLPKLSPINRNRKWVVDPHIILFDGYRFHKRLQK